MTPILHFSKTAAARHRQAASGALSLPKYFPALFLIVFIAFGCRSGSQDKVVTPPPNPPAIQPPLPGADVPYGSYIVDASKGDTIYAPSGSILYFPPQSFLDDKGKVITGKVTVRFREFADALDQYLAGIPMTYDSAGNKFQFVSSAMCEIKAIKDSLPVYVNPAHKPEVHLVTRDGNTQNNLYYFDTVQRGWKYKGRMVISDLTQKPKNKITSPAQVEETRLPFYPPVMPGKVKAGSPVMVVKMDPASFGEFREFDNLKFQVDESVKKFNPKDSEEEWNNLELSRGNDSGKYIIKFSNATRTVSYTASPVLEGKDLARAEEVYRQQYERYNQQLTAWRAAHKNAREKFLRDSLVQVTLDKEDLMTMRLQGMIQARNILIAEQKRAIEIKNRQVALENEATEKRNALIRERKKIIEATSKQIETENKAVEEKQQKTAAGLGGKAKDLYSTQNLYMSFAIDGFGTWNCDYNLRVPVFVVGANFVDSTGRALNIVQLAGVIRGTNAIIQMNENMVLLTTEKDMMIWGVVNNQLAYLDYDDFRKLGLRPGIKKFTFVMKLVPAGENTYQYLRALIKP